MTNHTDIFKKAQGKLEEALSRDRVEDGENRSASLAGWRNYAANIVHEMSEGTVQIDDSTPEAAVARALAVAKSEFDQRAGGYWGEHKRAIVSGAPEGKLAKLLYEVPGVGGDDKHNAAKKALENYGMIKGLNDSFEGKLGRDQPSATHMDLVGVAAPYVKDTVTSKRYGGAAQEKDPTTKYVDKKMQDNVVGALVNILSVSERATRRTTALMEKEYKGKVDATLPDDKAKAKYVGHNLVNAKDQGLARHLVYKAIA